MRNYFDPNDSGAKSAGLSSIASAFQQPKQSKQPKQPKAKKEKPPTTPAPAAAAITPQASNNAAIKPTSFQVPKMPGLGSIKATPSKRGGRVRKTGLALVHSGELIVPAKHARRKASGHKRTITKA